MELLFIGVACTDEAINESNKKYYNNVGQVRPQQYFDFNLVTGFSRECNVTAITNPPVATYPKSKCLFYRRKSDLISESLLIKYIPLINLPIFKTLIIMCYIFLSVLTFYIKKRKDNPAILLGYISFYTALPTLAIARLFNIKVNVVVPDVPKYISTYSKNTNSIKMIITKMVTNLQSNIEHMFDGYIFLTNAMNDLINRNNRPFIVNEGMIRKDDFNVERVEKYSKPKVIMYAGTLHVKFGIKKLVDAFRFSEIENCELWIFGDGDFKEELINIANKNTKIKYMGSLSRSAILEMEKKVTLLVNPRPSSEDFTKFSFPSKTLEYMASGTPLLTTKLSGIPKDYGDYLYFFNDESVEGMAKKLNNILSKSDKELNEFGLRAREYVFNNKNNIIQTKKIINFLKDNN